MDRIQILPQEIISKIAAGEVVERPASVLKELVENSIDAQAGSITVNLADAGRKLIEVKDNGTGIAESDINTIFNRHATSKIHSIEDLYNIESLGFRGEALYSIGAIADIIVRSKTKAEQIGWEIHVRANKKLSQKPATMQNGTEIQVKELFFNTPARRKFLKSNTSELNHLIDIFLPYALLYPEVRFAMHHETRKIIDLAPAKSLIQRVSEALHLDPKDILEDKREYKEDNISIHLILGDMNIQRTRKDTQFIFINNRPVQNRTISYHLNDIYRLLFSRGIYPFFCAYFNMPATDVDVNVHPAKREVKLKDEIKLVSILRHFAENTLMAKSKTKQADKRIFSIKESESQIIYSKELKSPGYTSTPAIQRSLSLEENILLFHPEEVFKRHNDTLKGKLKQSRYLGNLLKKYLLFESPDSLLVIDQHAAQERITFERLKTQIEKGKVEVQQLLTPILLKLTPQEILLWEGCIDNLEKMGFSTSLFDKNTLALHSHPQLITQPETSLRNLLAGDNIQKMDPEAMARLACRSSVMAGTQMNKEQAEYQQKQLLLCKDPFTCPHGRPIVIEITVMNLNKQFLR